MSMSLQKLTKYPLNDPACLMEFTVPKGPLNMGDAEPRAVGVENTALCDCMLMPHAVVTSFEVIAVTGCSADTTTPPESVDH